MIDLFKDIDNALKEIAHGWTSPHKAFKMASMVLALQPDITIEIGVWYGKGVVSLGLAHKAISKGIVIGIDPYDPQASEVGQMDANKEWWPAQDHDVAYHMCLANINKYGVSEFVKIVRQTSDAYACPNGIGLLRIDGNHSIQGYKDAVKYAPLVRVGGILILDDMDWQGGAIQRAYSWLKQNGWVDLYRLDDGIAMQRVR